MACLPLQQALTECHRSRLTAYRLPLTAHRLYRDYPPLLPDAHVQRCCDQVENLRRRFVFERRRQPLRAERGVGEPYVEIVPAAELNRRITQRSVLEHEAPLRPAEVALERHAALDREVTGRAHTTHVPLREQQGIRGLVGRVGTPRGGERHPALRNDDVHHRVGWVRPYHETSAEVPRHPVRGPDGKRMPVLMDDREVPLAFEINCPRPPPESHGIAQ